MQTGSQVNSAWPSLRG